jgi:predicted protein tyrosine phosphatase
MANAKSDQSHDVKPSYEREFNEYYTIQEVYPGIFISNEGQAENEDQLRKNNIAAILSVCDYPTITSIQAMYRRLKIDYHYIDMQDEYTYDILRHFVITNAIIGTYHERKQNILVHCSAGMSRSPTLVAAYLINIGFMDCPDKAIQYLKCRRTAIEPNSSFMQQLADYCAILAEAD